MLFKTNRFFFTFFNIWIVDWQGTTNSNITMNVAWNYYIILSELFKNAFIWTLTIFGHGFIMSVCGLGRGRCLLKGWGKSPLATKLYSSDCE